MPLERRIGGAASRGRNLPCSIAILGGRSLGGSKQDQGNYCGNRWRYHKIADCFEGRQYGNPQYPIPAPGREKLLKLDPGNTELLAQKHRILGDAVRETKDAQDYLAKADTYIKNGDYVKALAALENGAQATGEAQLTEKAEYLREHAYDEAGNETKSISYDEDGSILDWCESQYDALGSQTKYTFYNPEN